MQWDFSPEHIVKGEIGYGLEQFRNDLAEELRANLGTDDPAAFQQSFDLIYDMCYWLATGRDFAAFARTLPEDPPLDVHILQPIKEHMRDNIAMLGAILQRLIMDGVEAGMVLDQALNAAARHHSAIVGAGPATLRTPSGCGA
ncbi:MAG: hypothetical protein CVV05_13930 [Gammaproteobacteria bacterium HGW-Gammaproteobacteria-1]|jgi:hypothetical protein|nr:MAG: hypothetical protein CVV05_13930 [Gammaproteobacteria bacterium HGW-Gammaproteobacteria-1]